MVNKKILCIFSFFVFVLGLFLFPNSVFALPTSVYEFKIDNYEFANTNQVLTFGDWLNSYTFKVEVLDNYIHNYYIIYLQSNNTDWLDLSLSGGCNVSCFASNSYIKKIGFINGFNYFAIVLPNGKADCGVGTGACILDNFVSVRGNDFGFTMQIIGVDAVEDDTIINNNYQSFLDLINTQNNNTNSIINNQNQNTQNIINNQNQNWSNFNNTDLDNSDKTLPNTNSFNNYTSAENQLFDKMQNADTSVLNVAIDPNTSSWIWNRITDWLGSHSLLMAFLTSMLSIGIIKMALGR